MSLGNYICNLLFGAVAEPTDWDAKHKADEQHMRHKQREFLSDFDRQVDEIEAKAEHPSAEGHAPPAPASR